MLKQLTFYGKQTQAQQMRQDLFQPFAAIITPSPDFGMNVYQKLREYRHVRDYQWTFRPTAEEVQETLEKAIESKRMPKFDNRLPTLKERGKLLMDQKASTIADLAHILGRETEIARNKGKLEEERIKKAEEIKEAKWTRVEKVALRARAGELQKYDAWVKRREEEIETAESEKSKARGKKGLMMLKIKRNELLRAKEALDFVQGLEVSLSQRLKWNQNLSTMVQSRTKRIVNPEKPPPPPEETEEEPEETAPHISLKKKSKNMPNNSPPKIRFTTDVRETRDGYQGPEDILIQWKDKNDAFYAYDWPPEVMHEQIEKELVGGVLRSFDDTGKGSKVTKLTVPDSKYPGNENVMDGESAAEAEAEREAQEAVEEPDEKRRNSFLGRFTDTAKADGEEARR